MKVLLRLTFVILAGSFSLPAQDPAADSTRLLQQVDEYQSAGKFVEAIATIGKLIDLAPDDATLLVRRARFYMFVDDKANARKDVDRAVKINPDDKLILTSATRVLDTGDREDCERILAFTDSYLTRDPSSAEILGIRVSPKICLGDLAGAYNDVSLAIELDPRNTTYRINRTNILARLGDTNQALTLLQKLIESLTTALTTSKDSEEKAAAKRELTTTYGALARIHGQNGEDELALLAVSKAIDLDPRDPDFRTRINLYKKVARYREAVTDISTLMERRKQSRFEFPKRSKGPIPETFGKSDDRAAARLFGERGDLYLQLGKYDEAIADFEECGKLDPELKAACAKRIETATQKKMPPQNQ